MEWKLVRSGSKSFGFQPLPAAQAGLQPPGSVFEVTLFVLRPTTITSSPKKTALVVSASSAAATAADDFLADFLRGGGEVKGEDGRQRSHTDRVIARCTLNADAFPMRCPWIVVRCYDSQIICQSGNSKQHGPPFRKGTALRCLHLLLLKGLTNEKHITQLQVFLYRSWLLVWTGSGDTTSGYLAGCDMFCIKSLTQALFRAVSSLPGGSAPATASGV